MHKVRFPNEPKSYRTKRNALLEAEKKLRRQTEKASRAAARWSPTATCTGRRWRSLAGCALRCSTRVFVKDGAAIRHAYATELFFEPSDKGQNPRHVDPIWPLWNLLDFTPEGRGDWYPKLAY